VAVQVPRLNRIEPSQTMPQNDRINIQARDQASNILNRTEAISNLGEKGIEIHQEFEAAKIETLSNEVEQKYSAWNAEELAQLKKIQGDPTVAYVEYEKRSREKYEELLAERPDLGENVKLGMRSRLSKVYANQDVAAKKQRGAQQETYDHNLFEATVKLNKDSLPVKAGYVQVGDPTSYTMFEDGMNDIKNLVAKRGLKQGTVTRLPDDAEKYSHKFIDENGKEVKVQFTDLAKVRIAKELSEGVKNSIDVLISSGQLDAAKEMREKYKGYIDPVSEGKLDKRFNTASRKGQAYKVLSTLPKTPAARDAAIEKLDDLELKSEVLKIVNTDDRAREAMKDRRHKANYERLSENVMKRMNSDQPFYGMADLENDPVFKATFDNMSPTQQKAVIEMVDAPKNSNPKSVTKVNELFANDNDDLLESLSYETFQSEYLVGLSKSDKSKWTRRFEKLKDPTMFESRSAIREGNQLLKRYLLQEGKISERYGQMSKGDQEELTEYQDKLLEFFNNRSTLPTREAMVKYVKDLAADRVREKMKTPASAKAPIPVLEPQETPSMSVLDGLSAIEKMQLQNDFKKENGFPTAPSLSDPRFLSFVAKRRKG
jgi:transcriptional regulator of met regulon